MRHSGSRCAIPGADRVAEYASEHGAVAQISFLFGKYRYWTELRYSGGDLILCSPSEGMASKGL